MLAAAESLLATDELKAAARRNLAAIVNAFLTWRQDAVQMPHTDLAMKVLDESGYTGFWQAQKTPEAEGRLENLKELVNAMDGFENLEGFLEHISLVMDGDNTTNEGEVTLMTLHAAKGLEFDTVFLPGWEEGLFPSSGHWMKRAAVASKKNVGWPMSASPAPNGGFIFPIHHRGVSTGSGNRRSRHALLPNCPRTRLSKMSNRG